MQQGNLNVFKICTKVENVQNCQISIEIEFFFSITRAKR